MLFKDGDKIVFAGDSVTDAGRKRPVGEVLREGVGNGYVRLIDSFLATEFTVLRIINMEASCNASK